MNENKKLNIGVVGATGVGKPIEDGVTVYESTKGAPVATLIHPGGHELPKPVDCCHAGFACPGLNWAPWPAG